MLSLIEIMQHALRGKRWIILQPSQADPYNAENSYSSPPSHFANPFPSVTETQGSLT